jgi:hypothetical protein
MVHVQSPELSWLKVFSGADPVFNDVLARADSATATGALRDVLPYSIVVENQSSIPLIGLEVRFTIATAGKGPMTKTFFFNSLGRPGECILLPGRSRVITPVNSLNVSGSGLSTEDPFRPGAVAEQIRVLQNADTVSVAVDLVIASDGRMAGPDRGGTLQRLKGSAEGYRQMRAEYLSRPDSLHDAPSASLEQWLETEAAQKVMINPQTRTPDSAQVVRKQLARRWLAQIKSGQKQQLNDRLAAFPVEIEFAQVLSLKGGLK